MKLKMLTMAILFGASSMASATVTTQAATEAPKMASPMELIASAPTSGKIMQAISSKGFKVVKTERVSPDLNVHLLEAPNGQKSVVFTDKANNFLINGSILDANLRPINQFYNERLNPTIPIDPELFKKVKAEQLDKISGINLSDESLPTIYMFSETLCPFCAKAHAYFQEQGMDGNKKVNIKILPMKIHDGAEKSWSDVYTSTNPLEHLDSVFAELMDGKSPTVSGDLDAKAIGDINLTAEAARAFEINGTPGFIYFDEKENKVTFVNGFNQPKIQALIDMVSESK